MIGLIVNGLSKAVGGYFEHSAKKAQAKSDLKIAEIDAKTAVQKKVAEGKVEWETAMAKASDDSWKDEAWTLPFILILFAAFVPALQPYMKEGFLFLKNDCPDWISYGILASIAGSFVLKGIAKIKK